MAIHSMAKIDNMASADAWTAGDVVSERYSRRRLTGSRMSAHCRGLRYNGGVGRWSYIAGNVVLVAMKPAAPSTHRRWFTNPGKRNWHQLPREQGCKLREVLGGGREAKLCIGIVPLFLSLTIIVPRQSVLPVHLLGLDALLSRDRCGSWGRQTPG